MNDLFIYARNGNLANRKFKEDNYGKFLIPDNYLTFYEVVEELFKKCSTEEEKNRLGEEIIKFNENKLEDFFVFCHYLAKKIRETNNFTGVGRGSSVSLFSLYLMGLHRVNPLKYNLCYREFFKD